VANTPYYNERKEKEGLFYSLIENSKLPSWAISATINPVNKSILGLRLE